MAWFHLDAVEQVLNTEQSLFCFEWAQGHAKSTVLSLFLPIYMSLTNRTKNLLLVSKSKENATELLIDIQSELQTNDLLINDFGDFKLDGPWSKGKFTTQQGVHYNAIGREQSPRGTKHNGYRVDTIIVDDIDDPEIDRSVKRVQIAFNWLKEDLAQTVSIDLPYKFIMVGNRYASNMLLTNFADLEDIYYTQVNIYDKEGKINWKEKFEEKDIEYLKRKWGNISFSREYMNEPILEVQFSNKNG